MSNSRTQSILNACESMYSKRLRIICKHLKYVDYNRQTINLARIKKRKNIPAETGKCPGDNGCNNLLLIHPFVLQTFLTICSSILMF